MYNSEVTSKSARVHTHLITGSAPKHIVLQYYKTSTVTANLYYKNKAYKVVEVCPSEKLQQYFPLGCNLLNPTARLPSPASALRLRLILRVSECSTALWSWLQKGAGRQNWISHKCSCNQLTAKLEPLPQSRWPQREEDPQINVFGYFQFYICMYTTKNWLCTQECDLYPEHLDSGQKQEMIYKWIANN